MAVSMVPYGLLASGNVGPYYDDTTGDPLASVVEIMATLPAVTSTDNFQGRMVFATGDQRLYMFITVPFDQWYAMDSVPVTVGNVAGNPPVVPVPDTGALYWDDDTGVLFVYDGLVWQKAGGRFASQIHLERYTGDGTTTVYPTGASNALDNAHVEVFLDGVRQYSVTDWNTVGTNVQFVIAPFAAADILIRSIEGDVIVQNARVDSVVHTAAIGQTAFEAPQTDISQNGTFVFVNGDHLEYGTDYTIAAQDTTITSITKPTATTALVTTSQPHSASVGAIIKLNGILQATWDGQQFPVAAVNSATTFTLTVPAGLTGTVTVDPNEGAMKFWPPFVRDTVTLVNPSILNDRVMIRSFKNVYLSDTAGEANDLITTGVGVSLANTKVGTDLRIKSLVAGQSITITDDGDTATINAETGAAFEDRAGINSSTYTVAGTTSYVGVRDTSVPVTVRLDGIASIPSMSGRRVIIKDESGAAGGNAITVMHPSATIDGLGIQTIATNYGCLTLIFDGSNWFIVD